MGVAFGGKRVTWQGLGLTAPSVAPSQKLTWAPPALTNAQDVYVSNGQQNYQLTPGQDYRVHLPTTAPIDQAHGITIAGGRNIVLIGGEVNLSQWYTGFSSDRGISNVALTIQGVTGAGAATPSTTPRTIHVEGVLFDGLLGEAIDIDLKGDQNVTAQFQNIRVQGSLMGTEATNHADALQWYNGPKTVRLHRFTVADTHYQGLFAQPAQYGTETGYTIDVRDSDFYGQNTDSGYLIWRMPEVTATYSSVYMAGNTGKSFPGDMYWDGSAAATVAPSGMLSGRRPMGDACPLGVAGRAYVSPGYLS